MLILKISNEAVSYYKLSIWRQIPVWHSDGASPAVLVSKWQLNHKHTYSTHNSHYLKIPAMNAINVHMSYSSLKRKTTHCIKKQCPYLNYLKITIKETIQHKKMIVMWQQICRHQLNSVEEILRASLSHKLAFFFFFKWQRNNMTQSWLVVFQTSIFVRTRVAFRGWAWWQNVRSSLLGIQIWFNM